MIISSTELKAPGELIGWNSSRRPWVCLLALSNMNISETSKQIEIKFHLEHHWFSNKMMVIRAGINKLLVRIANREDPDQIWVCLVCLGLFGRQLVFEM